MKFILKAKSLNRRFKRAHILVNKLIMGVLKEINILRFTLKFLFAKITI